MTYNPGNNTPLTREIERVNQLTRQMINEYVSWRGKIAYGEIYNTMYGDLLDFVNFRIETADSCLLLIESRRIADSLGLSRALLENYLLLMLMCRGRKLFRLQELTALSDAQFKARFHEQEEKLREQQAQGTTQCLAVKIYPRQKKHLMYIFEGLLSSDDPDFVIPIHFFEFQEFRPETLRLKDDNYFQYRELEPTIKEARSEYQQETSFRYRHYLSYDALLQCLELNELVDSAILARIEAHYTFLGRFLHPTHEAARSLHEESNVHSGTTSIGLGQRYTETAVLLASLHACYAVAGTLDEIAGLFERAPAKFVQEAGTGALRSITQTVPGEFAYFWFLFNDPPLYDRFQYWMYHATDQEREEWGHYSNVPKERVMFDQNIYGHLRQAFGFAQTGAAI